MDSCWEALVSCLKGKIEAEKIKGNKKIIEKSDDLLYDERTAINQYMVHAGMCDNWRYEKLHKEIEKRAVAEMKLLGGIFIYCRVDNS